MRLQQSYTDTPNKSIKEPKETQLNLTCASPLLPSLPPSLPTHTQDCMSCVCQHQHILIPRRHALLPCSPFLFFSGAPVTCWSTSQTTADPSEVVLTAVAVLGRKEQLDRRPSVLLKSLSDRVGV